MELKIECRCGKLKGSVRPLKGYRAVCLCDDCQAYAKYLGRESDVLDKNGGTDILPLTHSRIKLTSGQENLKCVRLSDKGMYRWYVSCCNTPIANTMASTSMPYVGTVHTIIDKLNDQKTIDEAFGPILERIQAKFGIPPLPENSQEKVSVGFMLRVLKFMLLSVLRQEKNPSPFFSTDGKPFVEPKILSPSERASLFRH